MIKFVVDISTDSKDSAIKNKCLEAVTKVLEEDGEFYGAGYTSDDEGCAFCKPGKKKIIKMPWYKRLLYLVKGI